MLAHPENARLAEPLLEETIVKQGIERDQLTIHADRGSPMIAKPIAHLMADLGVAKSHSRPHTPNDNPYIESLKYRPDFPKNFGCYEDARAHCGKSSADTTTTTTRASAITPPPTSTTAGPSCCVHGGPRCSAPPTPFIPSASSASPASRPPYPRRPGSTDRRRSARRNGDSSRNLPLKG